MNRNIYLAGLVVFFMTMSCEETVTLETNQADPRIIIEGLVVNHNISQYVRVTRSVGFYDEGGAKGVTNAEVKVEDNEGNTYNFFYQGELGQGDGYYFSEDPFAGVVGNTYTLTVEVDGVIYTGTDELKPVTNIDSLTVVVNQEELDDPDKSDYYYEILFYAKEPQDREDFYLFKFYRNDSLLLDFQTDIYFADDEFLGEKIDGLPTAGFYKKGDVARVEMYSISRQGFIYYSDLSTLLTSDGGMFSPPPANPRTNLSNDALGYFQTSAVAIESIEVK